MTLDTELINIINEVRTAMRTAGLEKASKVEDRTRLIARRFGWDGGGVTELAAVAEEFGIVGAGKGPWARVTEICKPFETFVSTLDVPAPLLDRALEIVKETVPATVQQVEARLAEAGVTGRLFRLNGLCEAARMLKRECPCVLRSVGEVSFALPSQDPGLPAYIRRVAAVIVQNLGVAKVQRVAEIVQQETGLSSMHDFVRQVLVVQPDFVWLDESVGAFWLSSLRGNRLLKQIEKIVAVAGRITLSDLHAAINRYNWKHEMPRHARHYGLRTFTSPPAPVVEALCRQLNNLYCKDDMIIAESLPTAEEVLEGPELTMFRILKESGPLSRTDFQGRFVHGGGNAGTFNTYVSRSPIVHRLGGDLFGLVGER